MSNCLIEEEAWIKFNTVGDNITNNLSGTIESILTNTGEKSLESLYKYLIFNQKLTITRSALKNILGKLMFDLKIYRDGEKYKILKGVSTKLN